MTEPTTVTRDEQLVLITKVEGGGACRSCGNQVTWTRTVAGRLMPLEHELRVRALLSRDLKRRVTIRIAHKPGTTASELVKDDRAAAKFLAEGWRLREELVEVWEIPASLTHWANCKTAKEHRRKK